MAYLALTRDHHDRSINGETILSLEGTAQGDPSVHTLASISPFESFKTLSTTAGTQTMYRRRKAGR